MASVGKRAASKTVHLLQSPSGLSDNLAAMNEIEGLQLPEIGNRQMHLANIAVDLLDRSAGTLYPAAHVYCEKIVNQLREKFRVFSGKAHLAIEVRVSQDRLEGIEEALQVYVDAVTRVLDQNRGDWGDGMFYTGGYEATFGPVRRGGRNFIQTGKVMFEVQVSQ